MCKDCNLELEKFYDNWLLHHKPDENFQLGVDTSTDLYAASVEVLLSLSLQTVTIEDIKSNYQVSDEKARTMCSMVNHIVETLEDYLMETITGD